MTRPDLGRRAEDAAAEHLRRIGHVIRIRNFRCALGELDLVTEDGETIVFVEVRSKSGDRFGSGLESVDRRKRRQIIRAARVYVSRHALDDRRMRFDVVGVDWRDGVAHFDHVENAFEVGD